MKKIEKYTGEKTYMFPNGVIAIQQEVLNQFPAAMTFVHIVETDEGGEVMFACQNLSAMRSHYGIDSTLTETEAIAMIETILNTPVVINDEPTAEERIAAAMEYQNLLTL